MVKQPTLIAYVKKLNAQKIVKGKNSGLHECKYLDSTQCQHGSLEGKLKGRAVQSGQHQTDTVVLGSTIIQASEIDVE